MRTIDKVQSIAMRNILSLIVLLAMALGSVSIYAAQEPAKRVINPVIYKSMQYSFPDEHFTTSDARAKTQDEADRSTLGVAAGTGSIGSVGTTWYDAQHNGTMGRMITWGITPSGGLDPVDTLIHFCWTYLSGPVFETREYRYDVYSIMNQTYGSEVGLQPDEDNGGHVGIDVTNDNRAVVGGHNNAAAAVDTRSHFYFDLGPGNSFFGENYAVPFSVSDFGSANVNNVVIWPKFRYVEGAGANDSVLHVVAQTSESDAGDPQAIYYFRGVHSTAGTMTWDYPPYVIDTIYDLSHDIAANDNGKVALVWTANLPCDALDDDTASGIECRLFVQWDNDVYYQVSNDFGLTWDNRVNLTNHRLTEGISDSWRPFTDMSALLDEDDGELHIVWGARFWPADANNGGQAGLIRNRLFHWSHNQPFIRTVHDANWNQTTCNGGAWQLNASKMSISQCNGFHYVIFTQFNDIPAGVEDDCAAEGSPGYPSGAANGELYVCISEDGGLTWDDARNITNTRTPGCDSATGTFACKSEHWPSMAQYGANFGLHAGDDVTDVVVPAGGTDDGWYLPVQYIQDQSPGSIVKDEGTWQVASVEWFMLACVDGVKVARFSFYPNKIEYPTWTRHGFQIDKDINVENLGNKDLELAITTEEDNGPAGWLGVTGFPTIIPFGLDPAYGSSVLLNVGGIVNSPGTTVNLKGRVIFTHNGPSSPDTVEISCYVTDILYAPRVDSVSTDCIALGVMNNGSFGHQGAKNKGMDWVLSGDCDTTATTYLYDASPVIGRIDATGDTIMNWSIYGTTYIDEPGFIQDAYTTGSDAVSSWYTTKFFNHDTSIALEQTFYAPSSVDSCDFIIKELKIFNADDADGPISGVVIGEVVDWDVPSDSGAENGSGFYGELNLIYQYGAEYNQDDTTECQDNDLRYGGIAFLQKLKRTATVDDAGRFYGAYTENNATYVYSNQDGLVMSEIYENITNPDLNGGFGTWSSTDIDSLYTDLHTGMCFDNNYTVTPGETLVVYTAYATVENGGFIGMRNAIYAASDWYCGNITPIPTCFGCCLRRGDVDDIQAVGSVDVSDLTYLVAYLFKGGPAPPCMEQANVDGIVGPAGPIDVSDLTYLVAYLFKGGTPPPPC